MNAPAATVRRESLWADEPVMRDGRLMDRALKTIQLTIDVQQNLSMAITSPMPWAWLDDAEKNASDLLEHIRSMRAVLGSKAVTP